MDAQSFFLSSVCDLAFIITLFSISLLIVLTTHLIYYFIFLFLRISVLLRFILLPFCFPLLLLLLLHSICNILDDAATVDGFDIIVIVNLTAVVNVDIINYVSFHFPFKLYLYRVKLWNQKTKTRNRHSSDMQSAFHDDNHHDDDSRRHFFASK